MPKGRQVYKALIKGGWREVRRAGSHRRLIKDGEGQTFGVHDSREIAEPELRKIAKQFGYSLDQLKKLI